MDGSREVSKLVVSTLEMPEFAELYETSAIYYRGRVKEVFQVRSTEFETRLPECRLAYNLEPRKEAFRALRGCLISSEWAGRTLLIVLSLSLPCTSILRAQKIHGPMQFHIAGCPQHMPRYVQHCRL
jgi:hypothetical protein